MSGPRTQHLYRRGAMYAVRFRLPKDLAGRIGVREVARSLSTADPALARRRAIAVALVVTEMWEAFRAMDEKGVTKEQLEKGMDRLFSKMAANAAETVRVADTFSERQLAEMEFGPFAQELAAKAVALAGADWNALSEPARLHAL